MAGKYVIRGAKLVDGTGRPGRAADVAVSDGRVSGIATQLRGSGCEEIDASGMVVAPGFVDVHTHYDAQVFWDPALTPSSYHGVTSVVAGNCGFSIAPIQPDCVELLARTLQHVEDMSFDTLCAGVPWDEFETFPEYLNAVERHGVGLNYGCYVGHTAVRLFVMGDEAYERAATEDELQAMQDEVRSAMEHGAIGFASSTAPTHNGDKGRPVPSRVGDLNELRFLLAPLGEMGRGVVALLPGNTIAHEDMFRMQREIGRPVTWTALVARRGSDDHESIMRAHEEAVAAGGDVWPQVSCRPIVFQINMGDPFTFNTLPSFQLLMGLPVADRESAYRDPSWRDSARAELTGPAGNFVQWDTLSISESSRPDLVGRQLLDLAEERGTTPLDTLLDVSLEENLGTRISSVLANDAPEVLSSLLPRNDVLLGLADSGAHVSQICDACFATDLLGTWVRDRGVMPLERAVRKLAAEPAAVYGLIDRGTIEVGKAADIVVFDPDTVGPGPLRRVHDFPADGERLTADAPTGVHSVFVNGTPIRKYGAPVTGSPLPGVVLRS